MSNPVSSLISDVQEKLQPRNDFERDVIKAVGYMISWDEAETAIKRARVLEETLSKMTEVETDGFIRHEPIRVEIYANERDPAAGGASHFYRLCRANGEVFGELTFHHDSKDESGCTPGIIDLHLLAVVRDRLLCFQRGSFSSRGNALAITAIEEAMMWLTRDGDKYDQCRS